MAGTGHSTTWEKQQVAAAAQRYGIDPKVLWGVFGAETGFGSNVVTSRTGAQGPFQFEPGTARSLGVDPNNFQQAAFGAAKYLSQYKGRGTAGMIAAYNAGPAGNPNNPETRAYVPRVEQLAQQFGGNANVAEASNAGPQAPQARSVVDEKGFAQAQKEYALGQILKNQPKSPFDIGPKAAIKAKNPLLSILPQTAPLASDFTSKQTTLGALTGGAGLAVGQRGRAILAPGADRPGASTQPIVRNFVGLVAGSVGHPLTITTGTNHNQMTVDGNVSDHWTGHASDIGVPVDSREGDMIAGRALVLAGVPQAQARQMAQSGGLYTLTPTSGPLKGHRVQIIWKTYQGGNHHNHVHIGIQ